VAGKGSPTTLAGVKIRLAADEFDFYVDVALTSFYGRWLAVANIGGEKEVGVGNSARTALKNSLTSLGPHASSRLAAHAQPPAIRDGRLI
jgi:hypothetical protein